MPPASAASGRLNDMRPNDLPRRSGSVITPVSTLTRLSPIPPVNQTMPVSAINCHIAVT